MKKVISLVLSVMMMLTMFAGCKASGTAETAAPTAAPTSSTAAETSADTTPAVQEFNVAIVQQLDHASLDEIRTAIVAQRSMIQLLDMLLWMRSAPPSSPSFRRWPRKRASRSTFRSSTARMTQPS